MISLIDLIFLDKMMKNDFFDRRDSNLRYHNEK
jgi:hypothetical protein